MTFSRGKNVKKLRLFYRSREVEVSNTFRPTPESKGVVGWMWYVPDGKNGFLTDGIGYRSEAVAWRFAEWTIRQWTNRDLMAAPHVKAMLKRMKLTFFTEKEAKAAGIISPFLYICQFCYTRFYADWRDAVFQTVPMPDCPSCKINDNIRITD